MKVKQFFQDLILENRGGKTSSKKVWGHIILILISLTYVLDSKGTYKINEHLFDAMLISGTTLIGASTIASIFTKRKTNEPIQE